MAAVNRILGKLKEQGPPIPQGPGQAPRAEDDEALSKLLFSEEEELELDENGNPIPPAAPEMSDEEARARRPVPSSKMSTEEAKAILFPELKSRKKLAKA